MAEQYNSNFTGPEIDAILGNAVRYDLAQALSSAQQAQARGNIAAAPNGYGYGDNAHGFFANPDSDGSVATAFFDALLDQMGNGVTIRGSFVDYPYIVDTANGGEYELLRGNASSAIATITIFGGGGAGPYRLTWTKYNNTWRAPEWTNPPLTLGVEYRTTERHLGKPVYTKAVNIGAMPAPGTYKQVQIPYDGDTNYIRNLNICANFIEHWGLVMPVYDANNSVIFSINTNRSGRISLVSKSGSTDLSGQGYVCVTVKYTKTTG